MSVWQGQLDQTEELTVIIFLLATKSNEQIVSWATLWLSVYKHLSTEDSEDLSLCTNHNWLDRPVKGQMIEVSCL
jgi:hypothetical protein